MPSYRAPRIANARVQAAIETEASALGTAHAHQAKIEMLRRFVAFDQYAFSGLDYPGLGVGAGVMLASDMPREFLREYLELGLMRIDPLGAMISPGHPWGSWHDLDAATRMDPALQPIRKLEECYHIQTRTVFAFYRGETVYGGMTVTSRTPFNDRERFILQTAGRDIHYDLSVERVRLMTEHAGLSKGEIDCLRWAAAGQETAAIAVSTGYAAETVNSYIKSAVRKLDARNRTHAVAEAIRRKLIS